MQELTGQQKLFVHEYLVDLCAKQAAIRAGYSAKTAEAMSHKLMQKPHIRAAIQKRMDKRSKKTDITAEYVLSNLKELVERCMQKEPVMVRQGNDWVESGEWKFDSSGANKSLELLGKHLKLFTDRQEITGADGGPIQIANKTDLSRLTAEELIQLEQLVTKTAEPGTD